MKILEDCLNTKSHNLSFIKFWAAILVIFSHSYHVTLGGDSNTEPLYRITKEAITIGGFAVTIFLFSSGLYITKSLMSKNNIKEYITNRLLRIFPLFIIVILLTVFVMGPIVTELTLVEYFTSKETYVYLRYIFLIPVYTLPGVFTMNPSTLVNGSLWTLVLEVICYIGVLIAYKVKLMSKKTMFVSYIGLIALSVMVWIVRIDVLYSLQHYIRPWMMFVMGMIYYIYRDKIKISGKYAAISAVSMIVLSVLGYINLGLVFFMPYLLCCIAYSKYQVSEKLSKLGNYSYAMYLIAFPIQQMVQQYLPSNVWINTVVATIFTMIGAVILYECVEKRINSFKIKGK